MEQRKPLIISKPVAKLPAPTKQDKAPIAKMRSFIGKTIYIQKTNGTAYEGVLEDIDAGWLTIKPCTVHGNAKSIQMPEVLVRAGNLETISHIHGVLNHE